MLAAHRDHSSIGIYHLSYIYLNKRIDFIYCGIFNTHFFVNETKEFTLTANSVLAVNTLISYCLATVKHASSQIRKSHC